MGSDEEISESRLRWGEECPISWDPKKGGKRPWIAWDDDKHFDLGPDPDGSRFEIIRDRIINGRYYPPNIIRFYGRFRNEGRPLRPGDRVIQRAQLFTFSEWPWLWSAAEVFLVEHSENECHFGYVTTVRHFGRGIWQIHLKREDGALKLHVWSTSGPQHWLFWMFLPIARAIQKRAWRAAVDDVRKVEGHTK